MTDEQSTIRLLLLLRLIRDATLV